MKRKNEKTEDVKRWFLREAERLWPLALGSVSLRRGRCMREHCSACASGEGHASWALSGRQGRQRFSVYVPQAVAPEVQQAVEQGRQLQELMREAGQRYLASLKRARGLGREFGRKAGKR
ncbi:MAG: hypothetical protein L0387_18675 [Acidobacteria bacterium]|nr:hypothetical protein [Acidobacteriota bacterium]MCI0721628.1 hypothetical protein [Acidobacteriota bacterium]